ncbi:MAG: aminoacetone oxidase family FAD-binding enzyme [Clostridiales bacterium]|nr:aminoacetone oxidase family FAD-binding enzyme [Clostridiales bacterium]
MEKIRLAVIGGGASGLILVNALAEHNLKNGTPPFKTVVFERGERVGKKLSSTGNGQGNVTNSAATSSEYFSSDASSQKKISAILRAYDDKDFGAFWARRGVLLIHDERGRAYPAGRQASALTDALRFYATEKGVELRTSAHVTDIRKGADGFVLTYQREGQTHTCQAETVVLCVGGKAAKNFGTDGTSYALAQNFGHTVTPLSPSLVQLKTDVTYIKTLKGIRVNNGGLRAKTPSGEYAVRGDIIFTDYGVSGDAVFRISAFIARQGLADGKTQLFIDFLPEYTEADLLSAMQEKRKTYTSIDNNELLFGVVNNQIGRAVLRRAEGDIKKAAHLVKNFPLTVTGSLGFDYAQVTKGGIPLSETDESLQSALVEGLYFTGEVLDVDGQCGGFNLQWAYSSACTVAAALAKVDEKI